MIMIMIDEVRNKRWYVTISFGRGRKKKEYSCDSVDRLYNILNSQLVYAKKIIIESE